MTSKDNSATGRHSSDLSLMRLGREMRRRVGQRAPLEDVLRDAARRIDADAALLWMPACGLRVPVAVKDAPVEPAIALSIVYVAVENLLRPELHRSRLALVFAFGLLHGLGFAGVLAELGLPRTQFVAALLSFNVGVEAGQLAVLAGAFLICTLPFGDRPWYRRRIVIPASAAIAAVGLFWSVERIVNYAGLAS